MSEAGSSQEPVQKKRKRERDPNQLKMNTANSGLNWWLVKVPKYLGEKWLSSPTSEVGKIEIRREKGRTEVNFKLDERLANQGETRTPIDHKLRLSAPSKSETIGILCRSKKFEDGQEIEERSVEGTIVQNAVCSPASMSCDLYMKQKLLNFKGPEMQRKRAVQLTEVPQHIKPVNGITRKEIQEAKGNEKRTRMDDNQLTSRLLELFEKHQYYTLKDLCDITKQPTAFLKEKLKEIAVYNSRATQRNMWELKPEYRNYD
ncbi:unnamed protein product [Oikopleura dioica]|uniref:General transcription factor IIF subunit 2 n=2 Tax=Oikopleura dioica TaxID=34765 RepID=E4YH55_OIKDI|nr:unnamed protein product [Oikopleura dioica]